MYQWLCFNILIVSMVYVCIDIIISSVYVYELLPKFFWFDLIVGKPDKWQLRPMTLALFQIKLNLFWHDARKIGWWLWTQSFGSRRSNRKVHYIF